MNHIIAIILVAAIMISSIAFIIPTNKPKNNIRRAVWIRIGNTKIKFYVTR